MEIFKKGGRWMKLNDQWQAVSCLIAVGQEDFIGLNDRQSLQFLFLIPFLFPALTFLS